MSRVLFEIIRTQEFDRKARKIFEPGELALLFETLARSPESGVHLGSGLFKVRIPLAGRGKRGGARVIYLLISQRQKLYLLDVFQKNEKDNLSPTELRLLKRLAETLRGDL